MKAPDVLKQKMDMMKEEKLREVVKEGAGKKDSWSAQQVPRIFHLSHHLVAKSHCKVGDISPILQMREKGPAELKNWFKVAQSRGVESKLESMAVQTPKPMSTY